MEVQFLTTLAYPPVLPGGIAVSQGMCRQWTNDVGTDPHKTVITDIDMIRDGCLGPDPDVLSHGDVAGNLDAGSEFAAST